MKKLATTLLLLVCFVCAAFAQDTLQTKPEKQKPKATYRVGTASVTVWENKGLNGNTWKSFKVERTYKKGGQWKSSNYFDETEVLQLKAAIDKAIIEESVKVKEEEKKEEK